MSEFKEKWEVIEGTIDDFAKVKIGDRILELKSLGFSYLNVEKEKSISKLIASAPEMLEEIKETIIDLKILRHQILDASKTNHLFEGMPETIDKWIEIKEQLIKKATE